jgi:hypothetical protein
LLELVDGTSDLAQFNFNGGFWCKPQVLHGLLPMLTRQSTGVQGYQNINLWLEQSDVGINFTHLI